ncbi:MAG: hypothetical protein BWY76_01430 [bacterium ADurb.Bin429]|nr:MAG: hypothetical protein BWY76_01430 [bacterium ADurb.Bin429]
MLRVISLHARRQREIEAEEAKKREQAEATRKEMEKQEAEKRRKETAERKARERREEEEKRVEAQKDTVAAFYYTALGMFSAAMLTLAIRHYWLLGNTDNRIGVIVWSVVFLIATLYMFYLMSDNYVNRAQAVWISTFAWGIIPAMLLATMLLQPDSFISAWLFNCVVGGVAYAIACGIAVN